MAKAALPDGRPTAIIAATNQTPVRREAMPNITIQWYAGRTDQQKREITAAITEAMVKIGKTTADQVQIVFQDVERSNWGVNGKLASDSK
jgi:4-oxalocrotonate tautomerase